MSFAKHLECSRCAKTFSPRALHTLCLSCQSPLLVRYHLDEIRRRSKKTALINRPANMWRYHEVMPVDSQHDIVSLGEGYTPLLQLKRLGSSHGLSALYVKDESLNPTGTFKARGLSAAVSMARKLGVKKVAIPTAGNAGGALAAYGARAGMEVFVFMPKDTPLANVVETKMAGAHVELIDGLITDAAGIVAERKDKAGWFDLSTLKEPYRIEGKKTMGYELAEQFQWQLPDVIVYPTGGGTGLIGIWKAFTEMEELGWIDGKRPRMVAVQSEGCAPIVKAFQEGKDSAEVWVSPRTFASGIRVPKAIGDFLILRVLRQSRGQAVSVTDLEIYQDIHQVGSSEGLFLGPEGAACWTAVKKLRERQWIGREEKVVLLNTGSGLKYLDSLQHFEKQSFPGE
ncbi:threonine synthase [Acidobacteria bacterium AH-259-L09]|nr:threonine synthase [Acidobacteria bacterium AH-259-L09]